MEKYYVVGADSSPDDDGGCPAWVRQALVMGLTPHCTGALSARPLFDDAQAPSRRPHRRTIRHGGGLQRVVPRASGSRCLTGDRARCRRRRRHRVVSGQRPARLVEWIGRRRPSGSAALSRGVRHADGQAIHRCGHAGREDQHRAPSLRGDASRDAGQDSAANRSLTA